jgi:hypothetical protein
MGVIVSQSQVPLFDVYGHKCPLKTGKKFDKLLIINVYGAFLVNGFKTNK